MTSTYLKPCSLVMREPTCDFCKKESTWEQTIARNQGWLLCDSSVCSDNCKYSINTWQKHLKQITSSYYSSFTTNVDFDREYNCKRTSGEIDSGWKLTRNILNCVDILKDEWVISLSKWCVGTKFVTFANLEEYNTGVDSKAIIAEIETYMNT